MSFKILSPPQANTAEGRPRRIGVELEFAGLDCAEAGILVRDRFGGRIVWQDTYALTVADTRLGDFHVELDMDLAHAREDVQAGRDTPLAKRLGSRFAEFMGDIGSKTSFPIERCLQPCKEIVQMVGNWYNFAWH